MFETISNEWTADELRVSIDRPYVCAYWADQLGVSVDVFRRAIVTAGPLLRNIKQHLKNERPSAARYA